MTIHSYACRSTDWLVIEHRTEIAPTPMRPFTNAQASAENKPSAGDTSLVRHTV
jgi:hypothetical protein